jgi:hypothetical protein
MGRKAVIDKSHRQSVKQSVNVKVHIGDVKRKRKARKPRKKIVGSGVVSSQVNNPYAQPYTPIYIQSGYPNPYEPPQPPKIVVPETNPLLSAIHDIHADIKRHHHEVLHNSLIKSSSPVSSHDPPHIHDDLIYTPHPLLKRMEKEHVEKEEEEIDHHVPLVGRRFIPKRIVFSSDDLDLSESSAPVSKKKFKKPKKIVINDDSGFSLSNSLHSLHKSDTIRNDSREMDNSFFGRTFYDPTPSQSGFSPIQHSSEGGIDMGGTALFGLPPNIDEITNVKSNKNDGRDPFVYTNINTKRRPTKRNDDEEQISHADDPKYIYNPRTGRYVLRSGKIGKELSKKKPL